MRAQQTARQSQPPAQKFSGSIFGDPEGAKTKDGEKSKANATKDAEKSKSDAAKEAAPAPSPIPYMTVAVKLTPAREGDLQKGYFFQPTIFSEVRNEMRVAQEEIFGPVVSVITFKDESDLIRQANEVAYGLSAGIWTRDITRAHRFAREIKAGVIWINTFNMMNAASPFGGYKQSGYGREMGKHALEMYTQVKSVWVDLSGRPIGWFGK